jgi:hypothetical protein
MRRRISTALLCLLMLGSSAVCALPTKLHAQLEPSCSVSTSDADVTQRLAWIQQRLSRGAIGASAWWGGWLSYAVAESAFGWVKYARTSDRLDRDLWLVTGLGSSLWVAQMLIFPMKAAYAPLRMSRLSRATAEERRSALVEAEKLLRTAAKSERESLHWSEHVLDLAWAVGTAAYVFGRSYAHEPHARVYKEVGLDLGLTVLLTEAAILSTPRQAIRDLAAYQAHVCGPAVSHGSVKRSRRTEQAAWSARLSAGGLGLTLRF